MSHTEQSAAPVARRQPHSITTHGDIRVDDYHWLRERTDPDVIAYLEAENAYTDAAMAHTHALQQTLYREMRNRIQERDQSVPVQIDNYFYYHRLEEGQQYRIYCRKHGSLDAPEEVLLDQNALAAGQAFCRLGAFRISPDHRLLAYSLDTTGRESYTLRVKDLASGKLLPDEIPNTYYGLEWGNDNRTLFYTTRDAALRPHKLLRHRLGGDPAHDALLHHEMDELYFLSLGKSKSRQFLFLTLKSKVTSEVWYIPANAPDAAPAVIHPREQNVEYRVEHHHALGQPNRFFITTNDQARNFRVLTAPVDAPYKSNWREWLPHREAVKVDRVEPFRDHIVVHERAGGLRQIRITRLSTDESHCIQFPEPVYTVDPGPNPMFDSHLLRFTYTSLTTPETVFDYNMNDRSRVQRKQKPVLGGYDPAAYETQRFFAPARDGAQIPISLVRRTDAPRDRTGPLLLYGYGAYGASMDPAFNSDRVSLLDRGITFAIAHVRGGGEMGRAWYEKGKFLQKKNTFTDFIACAEYLVDLGYTTPAQLVAEGRSAGGLLMGAIANMRPDLFAGIVAGVPFVDVINTMLDPSIPLTVTEYEEWGNPNDPVYYAYMRSYSPYDTIEAKAYPHILATAGLNDPRVQYWEPAKWVAKLRALKIDGNLVLLKTNMGAGHRGSSGRFDYLGEKAFEYAFILHVLGLADREEKRQSD